VNHACLGDAKNDRHPQGIPAFAISTTAKLLPLRMHPSISAMVRLNPQRPSRPGGGNRQFGQQRPMGSTGDPLPPWPEPKGPAGWISQRPLPTPATEFWPLAASSFQLANRKPEAPVTPAQSAQQHHRFPKLEGTPAAATESRMPASTCYGEAVAPQISERVSEQGPWARVGPHSAAGASSTRSSS